jgi:hypothetical protein
MTEIIKKEGKEWEGCDERLQQESWEEEENGMRRQICGKKMEERMWLKRKETDKRREERSKETK